MNIAVIGSGFGGLAAAIRLQAKGHKVVIFEKRDLPGGRAYVFKDNGFTFDAGPTVITAPEAVEELFTLSGKKMKDYVEMVPVMPFYRLYWEDGFTFDYSSDEKSTYEQIGAKSPVDVEGYKKFLAYSKEVFHEGYTKLVHVPFLHWSSMVKCSPQLIKLSAYRSVYSMVKKFIKDEQLREAFSFHSLLVGGNPFTSSAIYTLIHFLERNWGVHFPKGGTGALVQALVKLFEDLGGKIVYNAEVSEITTQNKKVTGLKAAGEFLPFDAVVSNAEVHHTYSRLLRNEPALKKTRKKFDKKTYSMSLFLIYFGTKKKFPQLTHHNVMFGKRYKELLKDIFDRGVLADDFSLYVHCPSKTDPTLAPEGCETFYALSPVPHLGKGKINWKEEGPKYADKILSYLDQHYVPGIKDEIITQRLFTPDDFEQTLNSHLGSAFSLEPTLTQSAYFRTHNRDKTIDGLYFVGAGTHPGAGVPGVINSAKATVSVIEGIEKRASELRA